MRKFQEGDARVYDGQLGFNVAASIKMRKSVAFLLVPPRCTRGFNVAASIKMRKSGCCDSRGPFFAELQCGRIYKDAEIRLITILTFSETSRFNVAASIKMRKFDEQRGTSIANARLQCGRIYKDAEMRGCRWRAGSADLASMWPHL